MKIISLLASIFVCVSAIGQKSYYFSEPLPSASLNAGHIDNKYYGKYRQENSTRTVVISDKGIFIESINISSISRETIRESSTYEVRNGFIFGVVKEDSIPCTLEGEYYYFGVRNREMIYGEGSSNILTKSSREPNVYFLNIAENGYYLPVRISFDKGLTLAYFDYALEGDEFAFITKQKSIKTEFYELIILSPNDDEVKKLMELGVFSDIKKHKKIK